MNLLTIFTPTFNRAYILCNLYESLIQQTNNDFVWLIVDDGSTDNTEELINNWKRENKIEIDYYKQTNQGKHIAFNKALELCRSPLFFCVDSDDKLTFDAVQIISDLYNKEITSDILGFYMRKGDLDGNPLGQNWPYNVKYLTLNELYQKYNYRGETAIILKTDKIRPFRFPQFHNENFVTETVFYDQINTLAPLRLDNRICYLFEYRTDGYSLQGIRLAFKNPIGTGYNYLHHINHTQSSIEKLKLMGKYYAWNKIFDINEPLYKTITIPLYIKIGGYPLKFHYLKLFKQHIYESPKLRAD